ncbi:hypothetical protein QJS10_CPB19g00310 [Acorus calamus]|uniref:FAD-binding domain-containing protein n=1 Tax=Acorus calamus TaxID=4465 RepID=A0AAV9CEJ8_ACOCL|nr:hypothetical protein QJS10_CPB19g00310 [Acorus calamus]
MEVLLDALPPKSIRFGCQIINVGQDPLSSFPVARLRDGSIINTKVLIGCDGANSIVAQSLGLSAPRLSSICSTRGFTNYPNGHGFPNEFIKLRRNGLLVGRIPVDDKLMYWFIGRRRLPKDFELRRDLDLLKEVTIELLEGFPQEIIDMVKCSNRNSIVLSSIRYRAPWDLLMKRHTSGTITVAGDAMHVMGPFLGQGGAAALEDAVVLARCISRAMAITTVGSVGRERVVGALESYVKERMVRLLRLSTQAYLTGLLLESSFVGVKIVVLLILVLLFGGNSVGHIKYDCGEL